MFARLGRNLTIHLRIYRLGAERLWLERRIEDRDEYERRYVHALNSLGSAIRKMRLLKMPPKKVLNRYQTPTLAEAF